MSRPLVAALVEPGPAGLAALLPPLRAALDGTGPAVALLPLEPVPAARIEVALRPDDRDAPLESDHIAVVVATSGSTGEPKGVLLTAAALTASAQAAQQHLGGPARWLLAIPAQHVGGLQVVLRALLAGVEPEVVADSSPAAFVVAARRLAAASGGAPRRTSLVPTQLRRLLAVESSAEELRGFDTVLLGGAAAPPALLEQARAAGVWVVPTYGMSETSGGCVYAGTALPGVQVEVGDGLVRLAGPTLAAGYRLRPDLTAEAFVGGWFVTGDLGRLRPDGRLEVLGRADDVIVTGGEKVAPAAVEAALAEHPAVAEVAVAGVPDLEWGARVMAAVVLREGASLTLAQAHEHVAARLGRVAAPRELRLLTALARLPSGKVDLVALVDGGGRVSR